MDPATGAALVNAGSGVAQGVLNQVFYNQNLKRSTEAQEHLLNYSHFLNMSDWLAQNEYNLPKKQYQRYIDAGMSPAAAMQAVAGATSTAGSPTAASASSPSVPAGSFDFSGVAGAMLDARRIDSENRLRESEANKNDVEAGRIRELLPHEREKLIADTLKDYQSIETDKARKAQFEATTNQINVMTPVQREKCVSETDSIIQQIAESKERVNNLQKQRDVMDSEIGKNNSISELNYTQAQGEVFTNYSKFVNALKDEVTRYLVENYHINPDHDFWQNIIEGASKGEDFASDFISALGKYASGVDGVLASQYPHYKRWLKFGLGAWLYSVAKSHRRKVGKENLSLAKDIIDMAGAFSGKSVINPNSDLPSWMYDDYDSKFLHIP